MGGVECEVRVFPLLAGLLVLRAQRLIGLGLVGGKKNRKPGRTCG